MLELGLPYKHGDLDHNIDYSNITFNVTMFSKNHFHIKYDDPLNDFVTFDYFRVKGITIPICVRKVLDVRINSRFSEKDMFDYNFTIGIKKLNLIHDYVLLVEDEIVTGIIVFDDIPIEKVLILKK